VEAGNHHADLVEVCESRFGANGPMTYRPDRRERRSRPGLGPIRCRLARYSAMRWLCRWYADRHGSAAPSMKLSWCSANPASVRAADAW
jgi:hypothetical protein